MNYEKILCEFQNFIKAYLSLEHKLVDCLEKCLIYGHIRRFAD